MVPRLYIGLYNYLILKEIIMPNGVCWEITKESMRIINHISYMEIFHNHDPEVGIDTETEPFFDPALHIG
jgi:hypothetical protein